ncbi:flagellar biosynthetic protein FliR [Neptunomonas marina]|uniref:Flagellar biosynthetic protein FliR n=1 Tax=Neptunomonas marina TaxID=1815562 RepID=A0A437Q6W7_9GAMM|nr:flagellar biosynthetic protein FliR [Neptunomonas marina]RVU30275.1 flagellar biosynthetic protein FliR [Neptunomonas marina]
MYEISLIEIERWVGAFLLPFFRVASFLMAMPVIGTRIVSMKIRLGAAVAITLVILPVLQMPPVLVGIELNTMLLVAQQVLIGSALGFAMQVFFQIFTVGGQLISNQMGLGFASMTDPANGVSVVVLGQFYLMMATLMFLAMDGHLVMITVLAESFDIMPVTELRLDAMKMSQLALSGSWMFAGALLMSLPIVVALLVVNLSFGIMVKAAPQLNIFAIGFPFTMMLGLFFTWMSLSGFLGQFEILAADALERLTGLMGGA